jgi:hypothetical protein
MYICIEKKFLHIIVANVAFPPNMLILKGFYQATLF